MAKAPRGKRLEEALDKLRLLAASADDEALLPAVRDALRSGSGHLAKKAAEIAKERGFSGLRDDLELALSFYLQHPDEDRGCLAKVSIARMLLTEADTSDELWLDAVRHIQMEASFGGSIDTAAELRGLAAIGVAASHLRNKTHSLIDLLVDPETAARAGAVRALGYMGTAESVALVRYKAIIGDREAEVMGECFRALLADEEEREGNLAFVARYLSGDRDEFAEEAALALGESRDLRALPILMDTLERTVIPAMRATLLRSVALLRREEAYEHLALWLKEAGPRVHAEARTALDLFRHESAFAFLF